MDKPVIPYPIIVEGKYDKIKIDSLFCADVFVTDGFGVFRRQDRAALFRRLAEKTPLIILTDSDGAGTVIRRFFHSVLPADRQIHLYSPAIKGKERRKAAPSKAGNLGIEGIDAAILRKLLAPYALSDDGQDMVTHCCITKKRGDITKSDLFMLGLSGRPESAAKRRELAAKLGFPEDISSTALLAALNLLYSREELAELV
ncbi:MAG: DUF4093 domain-containing protein [Clostridia bacterium]|nr:DUF4093 domain-containing protein [Clostridia bacterium]